MKSEHGLPARSGATVRCISREEEELRHKYAYTDMTFAEFEKRMKGLRKQGLVKRR